jgi:hypothetical protein
VWLVHDAYLRLDVALKLLPRGERSDEEEQRFREEAQRAIRISAPNVIRLYDYNPEIPYLVMEYCDGGDLTRRIMSRRPAPVRETLQLVRQICLGLTALHEQPRPIVHRDLKPGNVLLHDGVPKIVDFGLSKDLGSASALTRTRGVMGTISYASPEQLLDASKVDVRTDLWAVGVMLYEMLTWQRPFEHVSEDIVQVVLRIRTEPPAAPPFPLPEPVAAVLERALQKDPQARFASAREMAQAIDRAMDAIPEGLALPPAERVDALAEAASEAAERLDHGDTRGASEAVRRIRSIGHDGALARYWDEQVRAASRGLRGQAQAAEEDSRFESIRSLIEVGQHREARRQLGQLLIEDPGNVAAERLLSELTREEARLRADLDSAHKEADRARSDRDPERLIAIWEAVARRAPEHPEVRAELAVARRELAMRLRDAALEDCMREASQLAGAGDEAGALRRWEAFLSAHPDDTEGLAQARALRERLAGHKTDVREQVVRRMREAAERKAREEAERRAREAEEAAQEEAERKASEEADRHAREVQELARREAARKAKKEPERSVGVEPAPRERERLARTAREETPRKSAEGGRAKPAGPHLLPLRRAYWMAAAVVFGLGLIAGWVYLSGRHGTPSEEAQGPTESLTQPDTSGLPALVEPQTGIDPGIEPTEETTPDSPPLDLQPAQVAIDHLRERLTNVSGPAWTKLREKVGTLAARLAGWQAEQEKGGRITGGQLSQFLKSAARLEQEITGAAAASSVTQVEPPSPPPMVGIAMVSDADCVVEIAGQEIHLKAGNRLTVNLPPGREAFKARSARYADITRGDTLDVAEGALLSIELKAAEEQRATADRSAMDQLTFTKGNLRWMRPSKTTRDSVASAKDYCESSSVAGFSDWRLPSSSELEDIEDKKGFKQIVKRLKKCRFPEQLAAEGMNCTNARAKDGSIRFWTSTTREGTPVTFDFTGPTDERQARAEIENPWYVICVRQE